MPRQGQDMSKGIIMVEDITHYTIVTQTGKNGSSTPIEITIKGDISTGTTVLNNPGGVDDFIAGATDSFEVKLGKAIGKIESITVTKGPSGDDYWDLQWIWVEEHGLEYGELFTFHPAKNYPRTKLLKTVPSAPLFPFKPSKMNREE